MPKGKMWTTDEDFNEGCEFQKVGSDGYPFCASSTEIMRLRDDLQRANAENAKLRELVAAMPYCMEARCLECPMCSPFDTSIGGVPECHASWKLSALGVEVDDGAR